MFNPAYHLELYFDDAGVAHLRPVEAPQPVQSPNAVRQYARVLIAVTWDVTPFKSATSGIHPNIVKKIFRDACDWLVNEEVTRDLTVQEQAALLRLLIMTGLDQMSFEATALASCIAQNLKAKRVNPALVRSPLLAIEPNTKLEGTL